MSIQNDEMFGLEQLSEDPVGETTGRYLVLFRESGVKSNMETLASAGVSAGDFSDFKASSIELEEAEAVIFEKLGIAVVSASMDQMKSLNKKHEAVLAIEPERTLHALITKDYLQGYRDGVNDAVDRTLIELREPSGIETTEIVDSNDYTWGLQATRVNASRFSGKDIRVAILDTGLDLTHPDFKGQQIVNRSFVPGQTLDGHGHGTHCVGTACGPQQPGQLPRYGVAHGAKIYVGKVLNNFGSSNEGSVLAGIEWAIENRCAIVSMSLGRKPGPSYRLSHEEVAQRALKAGTLIIAAAGNDSDRPRHIAPVSHPANCPSIMAVGALNPNLQVAPFSNAGLRQNGGQVDIVAPGVRVHSSWPGGGYKTIGGTSMATPHVAGMPPCLRRLIPQAKDQL